MRKFYSSLLIFVVSLTFSIQGWAETKNGTYYEEPASSGNWYLMLEDFESSTTPTMGSNMSGVATVEAASGNHYMNYACKAYNSSEYMYVDLTVPAGTTFSSTVFSAIEFSLKNVGWDVRQKTLNVCIDNISSVIGTITTQADGQPAMVYSVPLSAFSGSNSFRLYIGSGYTTNSCSFQLDDVRLKYISAPGPVAVTGVSLNKSATSISRGYTETLSATVAPNNATNKNVTWTSSANSVATVDADGTVHAVANGTATITVTTEDGSFTDNCEVTVVDPVAVTGVTLNKNATTISAGKTETLVATIAPANAANKNVTWASNNIAVATVDAAGVVTGVAAGTATITVTTEDGEKTADCVVTVEAPAGQNGQLVYDGTNVCLMIEDFEGTAPTFTVQNANGGVATIKNVTINENTTKAMNFTTGSYKNTEYLAIDITLPAGKTLTDVYSDLLFDIIYETGGDNNYKDVKVCITNSSTNLGTISSDSASTTVWAAKSFSLSGKYTSSNTFTLLIGGVSANIMKFNIDNIRLKLTSTASGELTDNENLGWSYNSANTTLTFAGKGTITDYSKSGSRPWHSSVSDATSVIFGEGITAIGNNCAYNATKITSISLPSTLVTIGYQAFMTNSALASVTIPENVETIGENAFRNDNKIATLEILSPKLNSLGNCAFYINNSSLAITFHSFPTFGPTALYKVAVPNFVLNDNEHPFIANTNTVGNNTYKNINMTYNRTFGSAYSTIVLPFVPTTMPENVTFYEMTAASASQVTFTEVTGNAIVAGKPYLIAASGNKAFTKTAFDGTTSLVVAETGTTSADSWTMYPVFQKVVKVAADNAYGFSGGQLYKNTGEMTVNPFRAYFATSSSAKSVMDVDFNETPTAIENIDANTNFEFNEVYNINGVRQNGLQKGINIIKLTNGKTMKVIIK